ncbi:hypothetical protein FEM48_ZijujUnG0126600 [Ziziphus jujuba var. spinosa]|uniref:H(+)-transporting two-sector ATPase n=1 Tax=Ziziphus jujuba var. spinosa TaxID=714518 RepID=A0A978U7R1_ZIZJJ|nr:hypothetical protein FEM48_ZijujUnG0126600 [Ziziphus jujuba var. spinosa]
MPQLDKFTYFTQFFWSCLFLFTFYIPICNDGDGVLGISRILKLRNKLVSHRGNNIRSNDPNSLEDILRKGFSTGVSYMYSSLFEVSQWCNAVDLLGKRRKITKCFHTIDRHRLIPIFKEEIDDPKFFYSIQKVFSAGRLVGGEKGPYSVPHCLLLSALPGNIYLHKLDQEIGRIRQKYEIPIVQRIRSVLLRTGRIDDQENSGEEASFNAPQDNRAIIVGSVKSLQRKAAFHSLVSSWHTPPTSTPRLRGDQKTPFVFPPSSALAAFLNKPSSLLCAAFLIEAAGLTPKAEFYGRERCNNNWAMRDLIKYCKRKGPLIELGGEAILVIRASHRNTKTYRPLPTIRPEPFGRICWINNNSCTVIREVPPRTTPIQFLRELEKRLRVKHRIHITACHLRSAIHSKFRNLGNSIPIKQLTKGMSETGSLLDGVQLAETLGTAGVGATRHRTFNRQSHDRA